MCRKSKYCLMKFFLRLYVFERDRECLCVSVIRIRCILSI